MTAKELLVHRQGRYAELIGGAMRVSEPPGGRHGLIAVRIAGLLSRHINGARLGTVLVEAGYLLARDPDTVRGPDVSYLSRERLPPEALPVGFIPIAPDLAVEIRSPFEPANDLQEKVDDYLRAGTRTVWVVEPEQRTVTVHEASAQPRILHQSNPLAGGDAVPGFACRVADLFG
jgi:Uma2 family endonuclease